MKCWKWSGNLECARSNSTALAFVASSSLSYAIRAMIMCPGGFQAAAGAVKRHGQMATAATRAITKRGFINDVPELEVRDRESGNCLFYVVPCDLSPGCSRKCAE